MFHSRAFNQLIKEAWHAFHLCATPLLLAIILMRANAYSQALTMLHLSGTEPYYPHMSCVSLGINETFLLH